MHNKSFALVLCLLGCVAISAVLADPTDPYHDLLSTQPNPNQPTYQAKSEAASTSGPTFNLDDTLPIDPVPEPFLDKLLRFQRTAFEKYRLEMVLTSLLILYIFVYWIGRSSNASLASSVIESVHPVARANFARLGSYRGMLSTTGSHPVEEYAHSYFTFYSGRTNILGLHVGVDTVYRQEAASYAMSFAGYSQADDLVQFTVFFPARALDTYVFGLYRGRERENFVKRYNDTLVSFAKTSLKPLASDPRFSVITDAPELVDTLIPQSIIDLFLGLDNSTANKTNPPGFSFVSLAITDQPHHADDPAWPSPLTTLTRRVEGCVGVLQVTFKIPGPGKITPTSATNGIAHALASASIASAPGTNTTASNISSAISASLGAASAALSLPSDQQSAVLIARLADVSLLLADHLVTRKISAQARKKNEEERQKEAVAKRKEALKAQREKELEDRRLEEAKARAEREKNMTREQRKKLEEKERKAEAKKGMRIKMVR